MLCILYNSFQTLEWSVSRAQSVMTSHLLQSAEEEATKKLLLSPEAGRLELINHANTA